MEGEREGLRVEEGKRFSLTSQIRQELQLLTLVVKPPKATVSITEFTLGACSSYFRAHGLGSCYLFPALHTILIFLFPVKYWSTSLHLSTSYSEASWRLRQLLSVHQRCSGGHLHGVKTLAVTCVGNFICLFWSVVMVVTVVGREHHMSCAKFLGRPTCPKKKDKVADMWFLAFPEKEVSTSVGASLDFKLLSHKQVGPACSHMFKNYVITV